MTRPETFLPDNVRVLQVHLQDSGLAGAQPPPAGARGAVFKLGGGVVSAAEESVFLESMSIFFQYPRRSFIHI